MSVVLPGVSTGLLEWLMPLFVGMAVLLLGTVMLLMSRVCLRVACTTVHIGRARRVLVEPVAMLRSEPVRRVARRAHVPASMPSRAPPGLERPSSRRDPSGHRGNRFRE